jgi:hypothetical protein
MSLISRLESKFGRYAPPNVTLVLVAGQVICYLAGRLPLNDGRDGLLQSIQLVPDQVASGEVWRVVTYLFEPPPINPLFAFFFWYLFYLFGTTLESTWNNFRYNVYLLIGYLASLLFAFIGWWAFNAGGVPAPNSFLYGSIFLAFARLYPDFTLNLFFILPVKVKWLALATWIIYAYTLITDPHWLSKLMIVAAVLNYLLFFGRDILRDMKQGHRKMQHQSKALHSPKRLIHRCRICDLSIEDAPRTPFRYCSKCTGQSCYCPEHINNHEHVVAEPVEEASP